MAFQRPTAMLRSPMLMHPVEHENLIENFAALLRGQHQLLAAGMAVAAATEPTISADGVAIVTVNGWLGPKLSWLDRLLGGFDVSAIGPTFDQLAANDKVRGILFYVDSPGGAVTGTPENAARVAAAESRKPVVAFTDGLACSGAYWLASQASAIVSTPTAQTGSIGVVCALLDESGWYANQGYERKVVSTGRLKGAGTPGTKITDEQIAHVQSQIAPIYGMFKDAVQSRRPSVQVDALEGDLLRGEAALKAGLVDAIVPDMAGALRVLSDKIAARQPKSSPSAAASPAAKVPNHGQKSPSGAAEPKAKAAAKEIPLPTPKNDADAWQIWQRLSGPTRTRFYCQHDQAIWRGKRAEGR